MNRFRFLSLLMAVMLYSATACTACVRTDSRQQKQVTQKTDTARWLGGIEPARALEYMKTTPDLIIIDVREPRWIDRYFEGSIRIPWTEMGKRYKEVPAGKPVLLNCGAGVVAPKAYETLKRMRPDLKSLGYIAGSPMFEEYNKWKKTRR